jgi:hypothetical protein
MKVFLAFAFRDGDKDLVEYADQLLSSHLVHVDTGEGLGGEQLNPAVQAKIDKCDAVVGLLTRRDARQDGRFTTHQWVMDEIGYARNAGKKAIALIEDGVEIGGGMYQPHEFIPFDRANLLPAFLRLTQTIGEWKKLLGRTVKVQILPPQIARKVGTNNGKLRCQHRLWSQGKYSDWKVVTPVPEGGGTFVWIEGVQDEHLIQLQVDDNGTGKTMWTSVAASQWMQIPLVAQGGRR